MRSDLPIVVIGGGPAGVVCAVQLAKAGCKTILFADEISKRQGEFIDPKTMGKISHACETDFPYTDFFSIDSILSSWGSPDLECKSLNFCSGHNGVVIDRPRFHNWLMSVAEKASVEICRNFTIDHGAFHSDHWQLDVSNSETKRTIHAACIVESTGKASSSITIPNAKRHFVDNLVCVIAKIPNVASKQYAAIIESVEKGWFMSVALSGNEHSINFFTDADMVPKMNEMYSWFNRMIDTSLHVRNACSFSPTIEFSVCDARTSVRNIQWKDHWLPIGDASFALDPLSGDGIDRAVTDGIFSAKAISNSLEEGNASAIATYAKERVNKMRHQLLLQQQYYEQESRWRESEFWLRRSRKQTTDN